MSSEIDSQEQQSEEKMDVVSVLDDALFCEEEEENWDDDEEEEQSEVCNSYNSKNNNNISKCNNNDKKTCFLPFLGSPDQDEELKSLFSREEQIHISSSNDSHSVTLSVARQQAVTWILKVNSHYGFTTLTAVLAVNYLDRFLCNVQFQRDKPWTVQLAAVTCLSLAAKVEETQIPQLLDLQVQGTEYVFEAKTIQRMELLILSTLRWKVHPVTPLSFLDHVIGRLGLKIHRRREFLQRCEQLLLSAVSDSRFVGYLPSVVASAMMMRVIDQLEPCDAVLYQDQLLGVLKISKEEVNGCYKLISEISDIGDINDNNVKNRFKRKYYDCDRKIPTSPSGVIDASFDCDCFDDSCSSSSSSSSAVYSSAETGHALFKKSKKTHRQEQSCFSSNNRVFVDFVGSSR